MADENNSVKLIDLSAEHNGAIVCQKLDLDLKTRQIVIMLGADPKCIDALMRMIAGIQEIPAGDIELWGLPIARINRRSLLSRVCFVPRHQHPKFAYTVFDFVMQGCEPRLKPLEVPDESDRQKARQILSLMGIERLINRDSSLLTNRERQLVVLARALMQNARLMLLEEPFDDLDEEDRRVVIKLINDQVSRLHGTVIMSVSDPLTAMTLADRLLIFNDQGLKAALDRTSPDYLTRAKTLLAELDLIRPEDEEDDIFQDILNLQKPEQEDSSPPGRLF